jgi:hypothetical protein
MSVPSYSDILRRLYDHITQALEITKSEFFQTNLTLEQFRERVSAHFSRITGPYLAGLPEETSQGAPITLKDYGLRNRDHILAEIKRGTQPLVQKWYDELTGAAPVRDPIRDPMN